MSGGPKKKEKKKKNKKDRKERHDNNNSNEAISQNVSKCFPPYCLDHVQSFTLKAEDLVDGLRILTRMGSHFYPGRLTEISAPDIYGIVVDKERGNKPHIYSQEEVLNKAVWFNI